MRRRACDGRRWHRRRGDLPAPGDEQRSRCRAGRAQAWGLRRVGRFTVPDWGQPVIHHAHLHTCQPTHSAFQWSHRREGPDPAAVDGKDADAVGAPHDLRRRRYPHAFEETPKKALLKTGVGGLGPGSMGSTRGDRGVASSVSRFGEGPERFRNRSAQLIAEEVQLRAGLPPAG